MDVTPYSFYFISIHIYLAISSLCSELKGDEVMYIAPSVNVRCPAEPCLTLNQFAAKFTTFKSNTTLLFLPGDHVLYSEVTVTGVSELNMLSCVTVFPIRIVCQLGTYFKFEKIGHILIQGLTFIGCSNAFLSVDQLTIENSTYLGQEKSGTALEIFKTNATLIKNCSFISNIAGSSRGPIAILVHKNACAYALVGGAVIANQSNVDIVETKFKGNSAEVGAAIFATEGSNITIISCTFVENYADCDKNETCFGGALYFESDTIKNKATVMLFNTDFINNSAPYGGVISTYNTIVNISFSTFNGNSGFVQGGVLDGYEQSTITIGQESTFMNNTSGYGGVIAMISGTVHINNSIFNNSHAYGGGVLSAGGILTGGTVTPCTVIISHSMFWNNSAFFGGVLASAFANVTIKSSWFSCNNGHTQGGIIDATRTSVVINDCNFNNNAANYSGGSVITMGFDSNLKVVASNFTQNRAIRGRGGVLLLEVGIKVILHNTNFVGNYGGAIYADQNTNILFNGSCSLTDNVAISGGAIYAADSKLNVNGNTMIRSNTANDTGGGAYLYRSELICQHNSAIKFFHNNGTGKGGGIHAVNSLITVLYDRSSGVESAVHFNENTARMGGGVYLESNAELKVVKRGEGKKAKKSLIFNLRFVSNVADYGGAIYVADETCSGSITTECFLQVLSPYQSIDKYYGAAKIYFAQNEALESGSTLFGGLLDRCKLSGYAEIFQIIKPNKTIDGIAYLKKISNLNESNVEANISSPPVRVCFCNKEDQPDCNYKQPPIEVKKGHFFYVSLVAVDQVSLVVRNVTIYTSLRYEESGLGEGQMIQTTKDHCTNLAFSITSHHDHETLTLYAEGPCRNASKSSGRITVEFSNCTCPIGFQPKSSEVTNCVCECDSSLPQYITDCSAKYQTLLRDSNFWITFLNYTDNNNHSYLAYPHCPLDYCLPPESNVQINLNIENGADVQCANNRSGLLCGVCQPGLSLSLGSSRCIPCTNSWHTKFAILLVVAFLSGIAVVALILTLNLTVAIGTLNGLLFYANVIDPNSSTFFPNSSTNVFSVFVSWLNLEIGIDTCFYDTMDTYWKTWLQLAFPTYIISLVVMVIILSKHSIRFSMLIAKKNPVATLATLILFSYTKLLRTVIAALSMAILNYPDGIHKRVWRPDATIEYLSGKHIFLFSVAILILIVGLAYTFLLFFWQWLLKWVKHQKLCHFIEPYHAPYLHQHRYWTGLLLLARVTMYLAMILNRTSDPSWNLLAIVTVTSGLLFLKGHIVGQIYKDWKTDVIEIVCYSNIVLFSATKLVMLAKGKDHIFAAFLSGSTTLLLFFYVLAYHVFSELNILKYWKKLKLKRRQSYNRLIEYPPFEDNCYQQHPPTPTSSIIEGLPHCNRLPPGNVEGDNI